LKLYLAGLRITLSQVLPVLQQMDVEVVDERPYEVIRGAKGVHESTRETPPCRESWVRDCAGLGLLCDDQSASGCQC
jgi:NAD-specific glutamate dehydrogenase